MRLHTLQATKQEASNAVQALQNSHLYGRHLVLEYANADDSIDDIREKTLQAFSAVSAPRANKRMKLGDGGTIAKGDKAPDDQDMNY
jgi:hypothetical protein